MTYLRTNCTKQVDTFRFVRGRPRVTMPPDYVAINPISNDDDCDVASTTVNFPTLSKANAVKTTLSLN